MKTNGDAIAKMRSIIQSPGIGLNVTQVQNLRKAIAAEFAAKFGTSAAAAIDLTALANELKAIGAALLGVK